MDKVAMIVSLLAIALSSVAYWRAGGDKDVVTARNALEERLAALKEKQDDVVADSDALISTLETNEQTAEETSS